MGRDRAPDWDDPLQASLRRAHDAIQQGVQQQDEMVRAWTQQMRDAYPDWGRERWQRRIEKKLRKKAEREAKIANASLFEGYFWTLGAVVLFIIALANLPMLWWLIFPAFGLGSRGARVVQRHRGKMVQGAQSSDEMPAMQSHEAHAHAHVSQPRGFGSLESFGQQLRDSGRFPASQGQPASRDGVPAVRMPPPVDPRDARVDSICDKILLELRESPEPVREIFLKPEQTVAALRETCKNLTRRERDVRRFLSPEEDARLVREREALQKRIENEADEVTRTRLASALQALEQQREQRLELSRSASRFEAEQTRISYTLESLYTQVVRMRSADSASADVAGAGLRRSLDLLSQEVNALADALEKVNAASDSPAPRLEQAAAQTRAPAPQVSPSSPPPKLAQADNAVQTEPVQPAQAEPMKPAPSEAQRLAALGESHGSAEIVGVPSISPAREKA